MKKGFTLIELLAVIVILAVIAVITIPLILGIVEEARIGSFKDSVSLSFSAAELYEARIDVIDASGINVTELDMKNNNFKYGKIIKNVNGDLEAVNVSDGNYCANGVLTNITVYDGECDPDVPSCTYTVTSGTLGINNYYITSPTIEFQTSVSKSSGLYYGVGYSENYETIILNNGESKTLTSTITSNKDGVTINGYVKSGAGKKSTCSVDLKIDTVVPTVSTSVAGKDTTLTLGDNLGLNGYAITTSTVEPTIWTSISGTSSSQSYTGTVAGTYYAWVKDVAGNTAYSSFVLATNAFCAYAIGNQWTYNYTGASQTFAVPCAGTYKLEVWGAQGGNSGGSGGGGGYSVGTLSLIKDENLFIGVGRSGSGYNGNTTYGGGATHIARTTNLGELKNYTSNRTLVLIVAGGGGGGDYNYSTNCYGGAGGGLTGGTNSNSSTTSNPPINTGGTQTASGTCTNYSTAAGGFGYGGGQRGGSGWYGGVSGDGGWGSGSGGSGYLSSVLTSSSMASGVRTGNGYATITLISLN